MRVENEKTILGLILHDGSGEDKNNDFDDDDDDNGDESGDDDDAGRENSGFQTAEFQENDRDITGHKCTAVQRTTDMAQFCL